MTREERLRRRFGDLADDIAARLPDREGLVFGATRYTFREVASRIDDAARRLIAAGVGHGDHVALWLNNCDDWIFIAFAVQKIGAVLVPINTRFRSRDLAYVLAQSDSSFLITHDLSGPIDYAALVREAVDLPATGVDVRDPRFPKLRRVILLGHPAQAGTLDWSALAGPAANVSADDVAARARAVDPAATAFIMYTSGTTGFPKGVVRTHELIANVEERARLMGITADDTILNYLPLFHAFGLSEGAWMSLITGTRQIVTVGFDPEESLDLIEKERVTIIHGFEAHMKGLAEAQEARPRDLKSLRTGIFAAGMLSATPVVRRGMRALAPLKNLSGFGMTETWLGVSLSALDDDETLRSEASGWPGPNFDLRIVDDGSGEVLGPGATGELQVRGPTVLKEYYRKPAETAAAFTPDGWFHTGDAAMWLPNGSLRFLGRYKDMLKVGGENVDPMETEGLLLEHPAVQQVAVVGLPDERLGEVAVAYVQCRAEAAIGVEEVLEHCRGKVASFKLPRHVVFIDAFPMTESGKIQKAKLREDAKKRFA
ncbi:MAG: AMP-binding protein [Reyranella sp.]|nr:AMP-binding protein [Reyranella sp.]MBL6652121.1 AMP-binding protein [Reyranella sp.]